MTLKQHFKPFHILTETEYMKKQNSHFTITLLLVRCVILALRSCLKDIKYTHNNTYRQPRPLQRPRNSISSSHQVCIFELLQPTLPHTPLPHYWRHDMCFSAFVRAWGINTVRREGQPGKIDLLWVVFLTHTCLPSVPTCAQLMVNPAACFCHAGGVDWFFPSNGNKEKSIVNEKETNKKHE